MSQAALADAEVRTDARQLRRAMAGLMLVLALASLDGNIVGPALPRIVSDLGGLAHLSWVVSGFAVASTATTPLYGRLSDQLGRRPAFFTSIAIFLAGSMLCGAAHSMLELIAARALQGMGAGGLITLTQASIADLVSPRERGRYQGLIAGVFAICSVAGPLLGGIITDVASWPWIFYINLPLGAAAVALLAVNLPVRPPRPAQAIDIAGFALLIGATCSFMLLLSWGGSAYAWLSPQILGLAAVTCAMLLALIPVERAAAEPALPARLFADRVFSCGVGAMTLMSGALFGGLVFLPLFFQLVGGSSATEAGLRMAPLMGGLIVSSVLGGRLVSRTGKLKPYPVAGLAGGVVSFACLAAAIWAHAPANLVDAALVLLGLSLGLVMPNITTAVQSAVQPADIGVATGTLGFFRSLGAAVGVASAGCILQAILHARAAGLGVAANLGLDQMRALPPGPRAEMLAGYGEALAWIFALAGVATLVAFAIALRMPERALRETRA